MTFIVKRPIERSAEPSHRSPPRQTIRHGTAGRDTARGFAEPRLELAAEQTQVRKTALETRVGYGRAVDQHVNCGCKADAQQKLVGSQSDEFAKQARELKGAHPDGLRKRRQPMSLREPTRQLLPGAFNPFCATGELA